MAGEQQKATRWFYRAYVPEGEVDFDQLLREMAMVELSLDAIAADSFVTANGARFWNALRKIDAANQSSGITRLLDPIGLSRRAVWFPPLGSVCAVDRARHHRHRARPAILRALDTLTHREFEAAGCAVATLSGADEVLLTPAGNEGGVDFFAKLRQPGLNHVFSGVHRPIRIVGQSKKYESKVAVDKVREFAQTLSDIRHVAIHMAPLIPTWFRAAHGPIIGWIISHNGFQSGAEEIAKNHGIVLASSIDLAEICAQSKHLAPLESPVVRAAALTSSVHALLA